MSRILKYTVSLSENKITVDEFLKKRYYSRGNILLLKNTAGGILCNGRPVTTRSILTTGSKLTVRFPDDTGSDGILPVPMDLDILYEDEDLLLVNKPADMPVHPSIHNYDNTLANAAAWYFQEKSIPFTFRCITRLDRDTTGVVLLAKNPLAASVLNRQIREHRIQKSYLALCEGELLPEGIVNAPIARRDASVIERCVDFTRGEQAVTRYKLLFYNKEKAVSAALMQPETGRTHQIRIHMKYIGHPLPGDFLYNPDDKTMQRQALHALRLSLLHPVTGAPLTVSAPVPEDMKPFIPDAVWNGLKEPLIKSVLP